MRNAASTWYVFGTAASFLLLTTLCAHAVQLGNIEEGHRFARESCSQCHLLGDETGRSMNEEAPPFNQIANTPGMTSTALKVFLVTPHRHMPELIVGGDDAENVVAYILSLKKQ
jgi:mono/diheme cytochrome c family protein